jgi:hypothetical protein
MRKESCREACIAFASFAGDLSCVARRYADTISAVGSAGSRLTVGGFGPHVSARTHSRSGAKSGAWVGPSFPPRALV